MRRVATRQSIFFNTSTVVRVSPTVNSSFFVLAKDTRHSEHTVVGHVPRLAPWTRLSPSSLSSASLPQRQQQQPTAAQKMSMNPGGGDGGVGHVPLGIASPQQQLRFNWSAWKASKKRVSDATTAKPKVKLTPVSSGTVPQKTAATTVAAKPTSSILQNDAKSTTTLNATDSDSSSLNSRGYPKKRPGVEPEFLSTLSTFSESPDLSDAMKEALKDRLAFDSMSMCQANVIPLALKGGHDMIIKSETSTGKTLMSAIIACELSAASNKIYGSLGPGTVGCIMMVKDGEAAELVHSEVRAFGRALGLRWGKIHDGRPNQRTDWNKDVSMWAENAKMGLDIVISTPGRFLEHYRQNKEFKAFVAKIHLLILDDAETLPQLGKDFSGIIACLQPSADIPAGEGRGPRQTLAFLSTVGKKFRAELAPYLFKERIRYLDVTKPAVVRKGGSDSPNNGCSGDGATIECRLTEVTGQLKAVVAAGAGAGAGGAGGEAGGGEAECKFSGETARLQPLQVDELVLPGVEEVAEIVSFPKSKDILSILMDAIIAEEAKYPVYKIVVLTPNARLAQLLAALHQKMGLRGTLEAHNRRTRVDKLSAIEKFGHKKVSSILFTNDTQLQLPECDVTLIWGCPTDIDVFVASVLAPRVGWRQKMAIYMTPLETSCFEKELSASYSPITVPRATRQLPTPYPENKRLAQVTATGLDDLTRTSCYQAVLSHFSLMRKRTGISPDCLVEDGNEFAMHGLKCQELPALDYGAVQGLGLPFSLVNVLGSNKAGNNYDDAMRESCSKNTAGPKLTGTKAPSSLVKRAGRGW